METNKNINMDDQLLCCPYRARLSGCDHIPRAMPWARIFWAFSPKTGNAHALKGRPNLAQGKALGI